MSLRGVRDGELRVVSEQSGERGITERRLSGTYCTILCGPL